ncbi:MAG: COQ9 family protein [Proteobacteria bacterium]|nr:COQ9 family protein [Pseudomonadota bacterium]
MSERDTIKQQLLARALIHVPFEGWSKALLEQAAVEIGLDSSYGWRLFPKGAIEAVSYWSELLDEEMLKVLPPAEDLRVREKVGLGVKVRLNLLIPYREAARKTSIYLAYPSHMGEATRLLYRTINEIWYYAGDTATDYNFYTKRGLLSWVYASTFLYWLKDQSEGFEATWAFLDRRISEVLNLPKLPQKIAQTIFPWRRCG